MYAVCSHWQVAEKEARIQELQAVASTSAAAAPRISAAAVVQDFTSANTNSSSNSGSSSAQLQQTAHSSHYNAPQQLSYNGTSSSSTSAQPQVYEQQQQQQQQQPLAHAEYRGAGVRSGGLSDHHSSSRSSSSSSSSSSGSVGGSSEQQQQHDADADEAALPRLVNLNQDPLFSECLVYRIREGVTVVGSAPEAGIQLRCDTPTTSTRYSFIWLSHTLPCCVDAVHCGAIHATAAAVAVTSLPGTPSSRTQCEAW
jgi:Kinesin-associated